MGVSLHISQFLSVSDILSKSLSSFLFWSMSFGTRLFFYSFCPKAASLQNLFIT